MNKSVRSVLLLQFTIVITSFMPLYIINYLTVSPDPESIYVIWLYVIINLVIINLLRIVKYHWCPVKIQSTNQSA